MLRFVHWAELRVALGDVRCELIMVLSWVFCGTRNVRRFADSAVAISGDGGGEGYSAEGSVAFVVVGSVGLCACVVVDGLGRRGVVGDRGDV